MISTTTWQANRQEVVKTHQANVQRNIERRLLVARVQKNQELIHLLEAEFKQLFPN